MPEERWWSHLMMVLAVGCNPVPGQAARRDSALVAERETRFASRSRGDTVTEGKPVARWEMSRGLREISGLTLTPDGRLFAHDDNTALVYQVDYRRGTIVKTFQLGDQAVQGDFESIAAGGDHFYLLTSDAVLYTFSEGADGARVAYQEIDTGLGKHCEFEAMVYDARSQSLILACKTVYQKSLEHHLVLYRWPLPNGAGMERITVPMEDLEGDGHHKKDLRPTDITIDPGSGNYVLLTRDGELIELTPEGALVDVRELPGHFHQPEGLAITRDGLVLIGDEAGSRSGSITVFAASSLRGR